MANEDITNTQNEETANTQTEETTTETVVVPVPEPGQALTVTVDAEQIPQLTFDPGTESTQEFVGADLVFTLDNGAVLTFEDFAASINDGEVTSIMLEDGSIIPIDALIEASEMSGVVYVVVDNHPVRKSIEIAGIRDGKILVSQGLHSDAVVITDGAAFIRPDSEIRVK